MQVTVRNRARLLRVTLGEVSEGDPGRERQKWGRKPFPRSIRWREPLTCSPHCSVHPCKASAQAGHLQERRRCSPTCPFKNREPTVAECPASGGEGGWADHCPGSFPGLMGKEYELPRHFPWVPLTIHRFLHPLASVWFE